ncbi:uncharacterized protein LOC117710331 [Arvicanthis niloticus]|uniref:uncharacterized protein LOC117710331 n=1 Tax=Arvicanthis niloticus TaxID=61156 RepID=UPI0014869056|nr:uncharacterized protein LOC117710331 [Arvicanthis niloticus]
MGGYLGRARPLLHPPPLTVSTRDLQQRPSPPLRLSQSLRVNSMDGCLDMIDSLPFDDGAALAHPQQHPERVVVVHTQQYPVEFPPIFLGSQHKSVPALSSSRMSRSSVILNVFSTKGRDTLRFVLGQPILIIWSFLTSHLLTQSRKETQISALQESTQVQIKKQKDLTSLGEGGEGFVHQEEGSPVTERPCDQGKDSGRSVCASSAFTRLFVNGVLSSFIPKPGPLGRGICSKNSAKSCITEYQIAFKSSCKRNAIASSYSSSLAQWPPERICVRATQRAAPGAPSGAQGASKDTAAPGTRGAVPGAAPGTASGAAALASTDDASGAATGGAAPATTDAAPEATSDDAASDASGDAARDSQGAVPDAKAGIILGAAFGDAACSAPGAAPGAIANVTSGAAVWADPGDGSGAAAGTDAHATRDASRGAAARATRGASRGAAARATRGASRGASARATRDAAKDAPAHAVPLPGSDLSQLQVSTKKCREKSHERSSSGSRKKRKNKHREAEQATVTDAPQVQQEEPWNGLPTPDIPRPVRRKIPLLLPHRRGVPLILPQFSELYFDITVDDLDLEKNSGVQWIDKTLKGKWKAV